MQLPALRCRAGLFRLTTGCPPPCPTEVLPCLARPHALHCITAPDPPPRPGCPTCLPGWPSPSTAAVPWPHHTPLSARLSSLCTSRPCCASLMPAHEPTQPCLALRGPVSCLPLRPSHAPRSLLHCCVVPLLCHAKYIPSRPHSLASPCPALLLQQSMPCPKPHPAPASPLPPECQTGQPPG